MATITAPPLVAGQADPGRPSGRSAAPFLSVIHAPVEMITSAVIDTTMIVSMKVWVIDTRPWRTGCLVLAAAATMAAEPMPDSLEKMPRAMPYWMAWATTEPRKPPAAAVPVNASEKIRANAPGRACQLRPRTTSAPTT